MLHASADSAALHYKRPGRWARVPRYLQTTIAYLGHPRFAGRQRPAGPPRPRTPPHPAHGVSQAARLLRASERQLECLVDPCSNRDFGLEAESATTDGLEIDSNRDPTTGYHRKTHEKRSRCGSSPVPRCAVTSRPDGGPTVGGLAAEAARVKLPVT